MRGGTGDLQGRQGWSSEGELPRKDKVCLCQGPEGGPRWNPFSLSVPSSLPLPFPVLSFLSFSLSLFLSFILLTIGGKKAQLKNTHTQTPAGTTPKDDTLDTSPCVQRSELARNLKRAFCCRPCGAKSLQGGPRTRCRRVQALVSESQGPLGPMQPTKLKRRNKRDAKVTRLRAPPQLVFTAAPLMDPL